MKVELISIGTGIMCGIIFSLMKLPIPAPPRLAGILGIIGIYTGYVLVETLK